jgi:hypothetical protein
MRLRHYYGEWNNRLFRNFIKYLPLYTAIKTVLVTPTLYLYYATGGLLPCIRQREHFEEKDELKSSKQEYK